MEPWIYLDNNATTQPAPEVVQAMHEANQTLWANPSSVHQFGQAVRQRLELARAAVARLINARERQLVFTSGGTESNNLALWGFLGHPGRDESGKADGGGAEKRLLITSRIEHSAVREPAQALEEQGVRVVYAPLSEHGRVEPEAVRQLLAEHAQPGGRTLLSLQWANNETGAIQPVEAIAQVVAEHRRGGGKALLHVDATQAVGKLPVDVKASGVDLMTLAGHKLHGPKGIGALYVRQGVRLRPINRGGPQERERRGGTENAPAIIGLGVAAELTETFLSRSERAEAGEEVPGATVQSLRALRDKLEAGILQAVPQAKVNGLDPSPPRDKARLWNTTNIGFPALEAEALLLGMSQKGLCASAGAACSSGSLEPSPVLLAMGVPESIAHGSIRLSLGRFTTAEEIDRALEIVPEVVQRLGRSLAWAVP